MSPTNKKNFRDIVLSIVAPLTVSIVIGVFVWYTNDVTAAEHNKNQDEKIVSLRSDFSTYHTETLDKLKLHDAKLDDIAKNVDYIRGLLDKNHR
jgi:hypothetical protein